jgi:cyclophilin family peptidyl-prolyl cis-trans isomerase
MRALVLVVVLCLPCLLCACRPPAELASIARWEDQRHAPADSLRAALNANDPQVRQAAARAAGRIGDPQARGDLTAALTDHETAVRAEAAFALGQLGDVAAVDTLAAFLTDGDQALQLAAADGLALLPHDGRALMRLTRVAPVPAAAAAWDALIHIATTCDRDSLRSAVVAALARPEPDLRWRALRCAQRAPDSTLVACLVPFALDRNAQVRVHAVRALGFMPGPQALGAVLASGETLGGLTPHDRDRGEVAVLRSLGTLAGPALQASDEPGRRAIALLTAGAGSPDPGIRREALAAMAALGANDGQRTHWRDTLRDAARAQLTTDNPVAGDAAVRAAAIAACAALYGDGWDADLAFAVDDDPAVLAAWLLAWGRYGSVLDLDGRSVTGGSPRAWRLAVDILAQPAAHPPLVRVAATEALVLAFEYRTRLHPLDPNLREVLAVTALDAVIRHGLHDPDFTVRATAAGALAAFPLGWILAAIFDAYDDAEALPEGADEVRLACLDAIGGIVASSADPARVDALLNLGLADVDAYRRARVQRSSLTLAARDSLQYWLTQLDPHGARAVAVLRAALDAPDLRVRLRAHDVAATAGLLPADQLPAEQDLRATLPPQRHPQQPPFCLPFDAPRVRCVTDKGVFVIQLDGQIAPNTCTALLAQIAAGLHDHGVFHRVVPDFVIQGGDPRGDGWGGPGYNLRCEYSRRPFVRGTVGIAHSGKDSGGSQWFVCHSPQPHLNGRYTVCGEVVEGLNVVDAIAQGDVFRLEVAAD